MKSFVHLVKVTLGLEEPDTQVTPAELELLTQYAKGAGLVVELGCFEGKTTAALAKAARRVISIDPFFAGRLGFSWGEMIARQHARRSGASNVTFIKKFSQDATGDVSEPIDFMFIDADHTYEGVKRDWEMWSPKMRSGGLIALHDSRVAPNSPDPDLGSVRFFAEEISRMKNVREVAGIDSLAIVQVD